MKDGIFFQPSGHDKGYKVIGLRETFDPESPSDDDWDHWEINNTLFGMIYEYYKHKPDPQIHVVTKPVSFGPDGKWIFGADHIGVADDAPDNRKRAAKGPPAKPKARKRSRK